MQSFIEQALVFISAAVILVPIFKRLGLGSVLGYLIAGMLVGPSGFKLIQNFESVKHFSESGIFFLLFIIGLEIQPRKLLSMRNSLMGLGGAQIILSTAIFSFIGFLLGLSMTVALVVGFALSLSSTAFGIQSLIEKNLFNTEFGKGSFSILLMQDLVAIPALAVIPYFLATSVNSGVSWEKIFGALALIAFLIFASRFLFRPVFRIIAATRSRDVFTAVTLLIVIGVAVLMEKVGLSAGLGTFIAGVLLADSEYRHELEANLDPFKGLLMGLFFIAVGMSVSLQLIFENPGLILLLSFGYLAIKALVIYGVGRLYKMNHNNSKQMSFTIAQGGEFAFVIFGLFTSDSILNSQQLQILVAMITVSMALNPVITLMDEKWMSHIFRKAKPTYDEIKNETPDVLIAGFGRFGQIFGRVLKAQGIPFVAIDHDSDQIELLRRFGNVVYYGDAARKDLLEMAGAAKAKYLILAIDDVETSLQITKLVTESFPNLKIFARARNRGHAFDLMDLNVTKIKRETFDSSINFVHELLLEMGFENAKAARLIERFKQHDQAMLLEQFAVRSDDTTLISVSRQGTAQLAEVLREESMQSLVNSPNPEQKG